MILFLENLFQKMLYKFFQVLLNLPIGLNKTIYNRFTFIQICSCLSIKNLIHIKY